MQIYVLASIALAAVAAVDAQNVNGSQANSTSSGSGTHTEVEAGVGSVGTYTFVGDWEACTGDVGCESATSVCVRHSEYYSQCKPAVLPSGDLCGQSDGTNDWLYDHCPADEKCDTKGTDFRCVKPGTRRHHHHKRSGRKEGWSTTAPPALKIGDWEDCSKAGSVCKVSTSTCVKHSNYFSQCMPVVLPTGALCGQNDGTSVWKFDNHCIAGETCQAVGTDFHCKSTTTAAPTTAPPTPPTATFVNDWEDCSRASSVCKVSTSTCVKHSNYFSQCMPAILPTGGLCGQADGTSNWKYDHCIAGETCKANGKDSHCTK